MMRRIHGAPSAPQVARPSSPSERGAQVLPPVIPRTAHFVFGFGGAGAGEPFHLVHYLAIASCLEVVQPDTVHVHCHGLPYGHYWDLIRPRVDLHRVDPVALVRDFPYDDRVVRRYAYAHHSDFVRLDVLAERGGLYADIDTVFVAPPPAECWEAEAVIGSEGVMDDPVTGVPSESYSNALLMAVPGAAYIDAWRARIGNAFDGTWSAHSCMLARDLVLELPQSVHVEPQRTFHPFSATPDGFRRLLEAREPDLDGVSSIHLAAHLWWEERRRDFTDVHSGMIDEAWVRSADTTYAVAARRFLPDHRSV